MDKSAIKKVHVVFKTHLDIGFTDLGQNVLNKYVNHYIPLAIDLAIKINKEKEKRFIWTVGSYLIDYYFRHAGEEACKRLEASIRRGDICWHGLAFTTHTELLDKELFEYDLSLSDKLDKRFGKNTISAKMTDVPGHTKAIIGPMTDHGKVYMHIGVNPSSMVPQVPLTYRWKSGDKEIIIQYSIEYGAPCYVEGMDEVLEFAHTGDNLGPQSVEAVEAEMDRIQAIYPQAKIVASTMDMYAESLLQYKVHLPVVEEEIGDTWIHGIASDPLKITRYRGLIEWKNRMEREGRLCRGDSFYGNFMENLLLVAEHTWGLDYKKYLADFTNWEKTDFQAARKADVTTLDFLTNRNAGMLKVLQEDFHKYRGGKFDGSFKLYESSHAEQMEYIWKAVDTLPGELKEEAKKELDRLTVNCRDMAEREDGRTIYPYDRVVIGEWTVSFDGSGTMVYLKKGDREWITDGGFGRLSYETYNASNCVENYYSYNRAFRQNQCWSEGDFSKPGLEFVEDLDNRNYVFGAKKISADGNEIHIMLKGNEEANTKYGCPKQAVITYTFGGDIKVRLCWSGKDANRMPEALWFDVCFDVENPYCWRLKKMGDLISPVEIVRGGNRRQHCVEELSYHGADGKIVVINHHSPLVSVGGKWMYGDYRNLPDIKKGFSYNLFNNKWGTNFKMWCEDDCCFEYTVKITGECKPAI